LRELCTTSSALITSSTLDAIAAFTAVATTVMKVTTASPTASAIAGRGGAALGGPTVSG
jgi:hypothetical protein